MKSIIFILLTIVTFNTTISLFLLSQQFQKEVLIEIPGNNYDIAVYAESSIYGGVGYLSWVNERDSIYSIYLMSLDLDSGYPVLISSDDRIKSAPKIAIKNHEGLRIVWQEITDGNCRIMGRDFTDGTLEEIYILRDSLTSDPQINLNKYRIVWIDNGSLYMQMLYPSLGAPVVIDGISCSSPDIVKSDGLTYTSIVYEKEETSGRSIYHAEYNILSVPDWNINRISDGNNRKPVFGMEDALALEKNENGISRLVYTSYFGSEYHKTTNENYSYRNPYIFAYATPTGQSEIKIPFFVSFDSDSLGNNNVFIKTFFYTDTSYDSIIHISDIIGSHYKPKTGFVFVNDTLYAAIFWHREYESKTDIWMAKTVFKPIMTSIEKLNPDGRTFLLRQNYPNPFNPTTMITFSIPEQTVVTLHVYDILGRLVSTLVHGQMDNGEYSMIFDAHHLPAGTYLYRLRAGNVTETKRLVLVR
jgi:hypothetical protein